MTETIRFHAPIRRHPAEDSLIDIADYSPGGDYSTRLSKFRDPPIFNLLANGIEYFLDGNSFHAFFCRLTALI
jgi:hypothetical protein